MFYIVGYGTKNQKELWAGSYQCPNCGSVSHYHLYREKQYISAFYIPFISFTVKRMLICDHCKTGSILQKDAYKRIHAEQITKLKNGEFPADVVLQDCNPKEVKWVSKIVLLFLAAFLALDMIVVGLSMLTLGGVGFIMAMVCFLGVLPLYFSIKNLSLAKLKRTMYQRLKQNNMSFR